MKSVPVSLRYRHVGRLRWWFGRRRPLVVAGALISVVVSAGAVGVQRDGRSDGVDHQRRELAIDCVAADVVEVVASGSGPVSVDVNGAMSGTAGGDQRVVGTWSGGPGRVMISYVADVIEWDAIYGFCAERSDFDNTGGLTS